MSNSPENHEHEARRFREVMEAYQSIASLDPGERPRALHDVGSKDPAIRSEVERMLRAGDGHKLPTGGGLAHALADRAIVIPSVVDPRPLPVLAGGYRIIRQIGEGGMGVVYEAEQAAPRRIVALKAIRPGSASVEMLARFEREAHILGRLQHPGIAQIYEAGLADAGQPDQAYFAMEFIRGQSLTDWCTTSGADTRAKLDLFAKICDAVAHAHQRLVIHRDLKPANILVDEHGQPKILDFGVARLEGHDAWRTGLTGAGQLIGTLAYMSPEQLAGEGEELDLRADIWSLGIILHEMLVGRTPHRLAGSSLAGAIQTIRETDVPPIGTLHREFRGDIDAIIAWALQRDRSRRCTSAVVLAEDIRRHLKGEPIVARQESALALLRKRMRRYQAVVAVASVVLIALSAVVLLVWTQARKEALARDQMEGLLIEAQRERTRADAEASRALAEVRVNRIERGRLVAASGNLAVAEGLIWPEYLDPSPESRLAHWALREVYSRMPCVAVLEGHRDYLRALAVSPDGQLWASASDDATVRLWDSATMQPIETLVGPGAMWGVKFSRDSSRVHAVSTAGWFCTWDARTHESLQKLDLGAPLRALDVSPNEPGLTAIGTDDGRLVLVSSESTRPRELARVRGAIHSVAFQPHGPLLAAGSTDWLVHVWNLDSGQEVAQLRGHIWAPSSLAFSPDGALLVSGGSTDRTARFWSVHGDTVGPAVHHELHWDNGTMRSLQFSIDGSRILASGYYRAEMWDAATHAPATPSALYRQPSTMARFSDDERIIVFAGSDPTLRVWESQLDAWHHSTSAHAHASFGLAISPDEHTFASAGDDALVHLWSVDDDDDVHAGTTLQGHQGSVRALQFSGDGTRLISGGDDRTIKIWGTADGRCVATTPVHPNTIYAARLSPDARCIATTCRDASVRVWDAESGQLLRELPSGVNDSIGLAFSPDSRTLLSSHSTGLVIAWNTADWSRAADLHPAGSAWMMDFLDDSTVACGQWSGNVLLFDARSGRTIRSMPGHSQLVGSIIAGRDAQGPLLVSVSAEGNIRIWDPWQGQGLLSINPSHGGVASAGVTRSGRTLLAAHSDGTISTWALDYYDRHIQGNAAWQRAHRGP